MMNRITCANLIPLRSERTAACKAYDRFLWYRNNSHSAKIYGYDEATRTHSAASGCDAAKLPMSSGLSSHNRTFWKTSWLRNHRESLVPMFTSFCIHYIYYPPILAHTHKSVSYICYSQPIWISSADLFWPLAKLACNDTMYHFCTAIMISKNDMSRPKWHTKPTKTCVHFWSPCFFFSLTMNLQVERDCSLCFFFTRLHFCKNDIKYHYCRITESEPRYDVHVPVL